jgi:hypothetical protein
MILKELLGFVLLTVFNPLFKFVIRVDFICYSFTNILNVPHFDRFFGRVYVTVLDCFMIMRK